MEEMLMKKNLILNSILAVGIIIAGIVRKDSIRSKLYICVKNVGNIIYNGINILSINIMYFQVIS